ncbi:hypothetical protein OSB04_026179 [Centaurea solstitialis]|uniref:Pectinesterase catalytic domain-containing protein n=1 Tax=Centaurea solstitialis TaxID=347529 RepID=A0AA38SIW8_9ASTR|nr:hypothetical protein OSB04_026179 [Centaurea solstitialis]
MYGDRENKAMITGPVFYHCRFKGYQGTLFAFANKQFYKECHIFRNIDFISSDALSIVHDCGTFLQRSHPGGSLLVMANGRKLGNEPMGFSLQDYKIIVSQDLKHILTQ